MTEPSLIIVVLSACLLALTAGVVVALVRRPANSYTEVYHTYLPADKDVDDWMVNCDGESRPKEYDFEEDGWPPGD